MAAFLDRFKWDRFATYTTNMLVKPETVHTMFRHHLQFIEEKTHIAPYAFVADEYGVLNGRFHIHALIGNVRAFPAFCGELLPPREPGDKPRPCCGVHSWPGGYARVFVYDPEIKASGYVSKYVVKNFGHYDLIGDFVQVASPETQLSLISAERAESGPPDVPPRNS
jgi:catechol 2,3-dioxygenase-like lactoylglutathione lyase family enzyme